MLVDATEVRATFDEVPLEPSEPEVEVPPAQEDIAVPTDSVAAPADNDVDSNLDNDLDTRLRSIELFTSEVAPALGLTGEGR